MSVGKAVANGYFYRVEIRYPRNSYKPRRIVISTE